MIRLCAPQFTQETQRRIQGVLDSGMLVQGAQVAAFEQALGDFLGTSVVACSNGTTALFLALDALGIGPGDQVIMPAFTWPSAAHAILRLGAEPVLVDIDPETLNLDPTLTQAAVTPQTRALLPIHQFGIPAPMAEIQAIANAANIPVVEDAACALGTRVGDRLAGTLSELACFSFHPRKILTTGEGGAVVTRDPALVERLRRLRNHGQEPTGGLLRFEEPGLNFRLPELSAAIGIEQVAALPDMLTQRRLLGARYTELLQSVPGVRVPAGSADLNGNFQSFVVDVGSQPIRDALIPAMRAAGVETTIGTYALPAQPLFRRRGLNPAHYPHAVAAMERLITLPLHPGMTLEDVETVVRHLHQQLARL